MVDFSGLDCIDDTASATDSALAAGSEGLLDKNLLFTSGVLIAAGTGVAGAAVLVSALPAQVITAGALSGGLMYAGHRKDKGLPVFPWQKDEEAATAATPVTAEAAA